MFIFKRVSHLQDWIKRRKEEKLSIGFVPTMGALHQGHVSLFEASLEECDLTIVSLFVNPLQFNDPQDLIKYPRPVEHDLQMLVKSGVDALFMPEVDDMYPPGQTTKLDFDPGPLALVMEGKFRPGHFKGVAEVMYRLLTIVDADRLYMGQKDYQQLVIVRKLIADKHLRTQLNMCPTFREPSGLAMSSRNLRLSPLARKDAGIIYQTLAAAQIACEKGEPLGQIKKRSMSVLTRKDFVPEYFDIVDGQTLESVKDNDNSPFLVACCAVKVEGVRLIDNLIWKRNKTNN